MHGRNEVERFEELALLRTGGENFFMWEIIKGTGPAYVHVFHTTMSSDRIRRLGVLAHALLRVHFWGSIS